MVNVRSILMRANRRMGAALVENNLVDISDLEMANEKLLEFAKQGINRRSSVLGLLVWEMNSLEEKDLIELQVEQHKLPPIELANVEPEEGLVKDLDPALCWATWTVPFDEVDGYFFVATCYYLSSAVRQFWEEHLRGPIIWYVTPMSQLADTIDWMQKEFARPEVVQGSGG